MVKRWTVILSGAVLLLFAVTVPVFADGGPHVSSVNSGVDGLTSDSCAGCHRAHTAQGSMLLAQASEEDLCLSCHGAATAGATTSVEDGVQYVPGADGTRALSSPILGALRGGGFVNARIDAGNAFREMYGAAEGAHPTVFAFDKKVGVGASEPVTSGHMHVGTSGVTLQGRAWGNGAYSATANAGPTVTLGCASCHNPHGNGQYRILNPIPSAATGTLVSVSPYATTPIAVTDAANPANATRNYTVIQYKGPLATDRYLLASEIVTDAVDPTAGDYWHQVVPYNARVTDSTAANHDAPNGVPAFFNGQMNAWCTACHSRYTQSTNFGQVSRDGLGTPVGSNGIPNPGSAEVAGNLRTAVCVLVAGSCTYPNTLQPMNQGTGDGIFDYRHTTSRNRACTTCHVSHGSNAAMTGTSSSLFPYPDGTLAASSRLLKVDNRGTCQVCHDPTQTTVIGDIINGPAPTLP